MKGSKIFSHIVFLLLLQESGKNVWWYKVFWGHFVVLLIRLMVSLNIVSVSRSKYN